MRFPTVYSYTGEMAGRRAKTVHGPNDCEAEVLQDLSRFFSPFYLMKDVSRGSFEERVAAYRHNRTLRSHLSACMARWAICCGVAIVLTSLFDAMGGGAASGSTAGLDVFVVLSAACATFIACGVCVLFVTAYVYVYLGHEH